MINLGGALNPDNYPIPGELIPVTPATTPGPLVVGSPDWWLERLLKRLGSQASYCRSHWEYYEGAQPLAFASDKFNEAFGGRYRALPANFMPLVVEAEKERLIIQGFRFGDAPTADRAAWKIWQQNNMDAESLIAHEIVLAKGSAYTMVTPRAGDTPLITIEDPEQVVLETDPGNRRIRRAALKQWRGEDGYLYASLLLPDEVYKYRSRTKDLTPVGGDWTKPSNWVPAPGLDEDWPLVNTLGVVPVVPLLNRPRRDGTGRSELVPIIGNQNAINFLRFSSLIGSDVAALPQRWAKNLDVEIDTDTGQPKVPFRAGRDNLWATRRPTPDEVAEFGDKFPEADFGQFSSADLRQFVTLIEAEIGQMASISRTPYHYLLGTPSSVPPTGESIKSSEAPLVKKVNAESVHLGEGWEETIRLALVATGQTAKAKTDAETIWADPETRNEATHSQNVMLQWTSKLIPDEFAWEELGYSAQQIARIKKLRAEQDAAGTPQPEPIPTPPAPPTTG